MKWILITMVWMPILCFHGQTLDAIRTQKDRQNRVFRRTQKLLKAALKEKRLGLKQLNMLDLQIRQAQNIIQTTEQELALIDSSIIINEIQIEKFERKLAALKHEYSQFIYTLAKRNYYGNIMLYLLASESFKQFFRRLNYLSQYRRTRKNQIYSIDATNYKLATYRKYLKTMRKVKQELVISQIQNIEKLTVLKHKEVELLKRAKENVAYFQTEILILKRQKLKFDSLMNQFIIENPLKARSDAASVLKESRYIFKYKHELAWPVADPIILQKFGRHKHPVLKNIWLENLGLKIKSNRNARVNNVFNGKIISVEQTYDFDYIVVIQHGQYFTVYGNLDTVTVQIGATLGSRQPIGLLGKDGELNFQIWRDNQKLDPEKWLRKK